MYNNNNGYGDIWFEKGHFKLLSLQYMLFNVCTVCCVDVDVSAKYVFEILYYLK